MDVYIGVDLMKSIFSLLFFIVRSLASVSISVIVWLISFFGFEQTIWFSSLYALIGAMIVFLGIKWIAHHRFLQKNGLSRREYRFIQQNLKEAKKKIRRLQKAIFSARDVWTIKQNYEILRIVKKIQSISENQPKLFFKAERFYYSHLDSIVELTEKYAFLLKQPAKNVEIQDSLRDTRQTLAALSKSLEQDLYDVLADDMDTLNMELDLAKQSINKTKGPFL